MTKQIVTLFVGIVVGASIVGLTANGQPNQHNQNDCKCCRHIVQLAEDVHFIRSTYKFDFTPPPDIKIKDPGPVTIKDPGPLTDPGPLKPIKFDSTPEAPKRRR